MEKIEKPLVWRFGVHCVGIKNRCRKSDFHSASKNELGQSIERPSEQEAKLRAQNWIDKNMKSVTRAHAVLTAWEQEGDMETWAMFSDEHNVKYLLT